MDELEDDHDDESFARPRKRLLKKGGKGGDSGFGGGMPADELEDWDGDGLADEGVDPDAAGKGKGKERHGKKRRKGDKGAMVREKRRSSSSGGKGGGGRGGGRGHEDDEGEREIRELWDTIAGEEGGGSEVTNHHRLPIFFVFT